MLQRNMGFEVELTGLWSRKKTALTRIFAISKPQIDIALAISAN